MKVITRCIVLISLFVIPMSSWAQAEPGKYEVGGAYEHLTGDFGLNGLNVNGGYRFHTYVVLVAQGDFLWGSSKIGAFTLSSATGFTTVNSNYQGGLGGARFFVFGTKTKRHIRPFGEVMLGYSRLHQAVNSFTGAINTEASATGFTWLVGGGGDYRLAENWDARGTLDFVRTHFVGEGQSKLRLTIGIVHHF